MNTGALYVKHINKSDYIENTRIEEKERTRGFNPKTSNFLCSNSLNQNLMAEARGRKTQMNESVTESDIEAAQQLIQLSEEDNNSHNNNNNNLITGKRSRRRCEDEEVDQSVNDDIALEKKIQEIFGEDEVFQPNKKKRYRSLKNVFKETQPVNA